MLIIYHTTEETRRGNSWKRFSLKTEEEENHFFSELQCSPEHILNSIKFIVRVYPDGSIYHVYSA